MQRLDAKAESLDELSPRQRQILQLMRAGKVNKEIANELQIGVGTVKQHVVALFKRLQVSNRAMAVARGGELNPPNHHANAPQADGLLQRRPSVILCVGLSDSAPVHAVRRLHASLAALAYDHDALFLARKGNAGDLIFGLGKISEYDALKAVRVLQSLQLTLAEENQASPAQAPSLEPAENVPGLRAALVAGLVVASMNRFGGWSGEAVASASISRGRALLEQAEVGQLLLSPQVMQLLLAFGIADAEHLAPMLPLSHLNSLRWRGERPGINLHGRQQEWAKLEACLADMEHRSAQQLPCKQIYLCGETGMGKSLLCRQLASLCLQQRHNLSFWRCMPSIAGGPLQDVISGAVVTMAQWQGMAHGDGLIIIDDLHLLPLEQQQQLIACARMQCSFLLLASRRLSHKLSGQDELIQLQRLSLAHIEAMIQDVWRAPAEESAAHSALTSMDKGSKATNKAAKQRRNGAVRMSAAQTAHLNALAKVAAGVPLFALELARHSRQSQNKASQPALHAEPDAEVSLALAVVVAARLDELALDRCLLQQVARFEDGCSEAQLADAMASIELSASAVDWRNSVQTAFAAGVVRQSGTEAAAHWQISHPLMRQVIVWLTQEAST